MTGARWGSVLAAVGLAVAFGGIEPLAAPETAQSNLARGQALFEDAKYRDAVAHLTRARQLDPDLHATTTRIVVRALLRVGDFARAEREASSLIAPTVGADDLALHGETLWSIGHFEEAAARCGAALTLHPDLPAALHCQSRVLDARGRTDQALAATERAIEHAPDVPEYHHTRAYYLERLRQYRVAADELERYLRLLPRRGFENQAKLARARVKFLRHFDERVPMRMSPAVATAVHTVPFKLERDKILVRARINGQISQDMVLDTGAEMNVLSEEVAQRAKVYSVAETVSAGVGDVGLRRLKLARIAKLEVGSLVVDHVPAMIKDPPLKRAFAVGDIDAFSPLALGLSMRVDYQRRQLVMARKLADEPSSSASRIEAPLWMHRLATVRGRINGDRPGAFVVDTGGQAISISRTAASGLEQLGRFRLIPLRVFGSSGWERDAFLLPGVDLEVDDVRMQRASLVVLNLRAPSVLLGYELGGILGHRFLSKYTVTLDLEDGVMRLD